MDIHPILVHFPIAILSIYAILEVLRLKRLQKMQGWFYAKSYTAIVGTFASYAAYAAGPEGGRNVDATFRHIRELHSNWATATLIIFSVITLHYIIVLFGRHAGIQAWFAKSEGTKKLWSFLAHISSVIGNPALLVILAVLGLCAITITGALGGSLVYGADVDPVVQFIYRFITP